MLINTQIIIYIIPSATSSRMGNDVLSTDNKLIIVPIGNNKYNILFTDDVLSRINIKSLCKSLYTNIANSEFYSSSNVTDVHLIQHHDISINLIECYNAIGGYLSKCASMDTKFTYSGYNVIQGIDDTLDKTEPRIEYKPNNLSVQQPIRPNHNSIYDDPRYKQYQNHIDEDDDEDEDDDDEDGIISYDEIGNFITFYDEDEDDDDEISYDYNSFLMDSDDDNDSSMFDNFGGYSSYTRSFMDDDEDDDDDYDYKSNYKSSRSKVFTNADRKKICVEHHGIIVSEDKDDRLDDYDTIMEFLKYFFKGDKKWIQDFREDVAERWMDSYCISVKKYRKKCKEHEESSKKREREKTLKKMGTVKSISDFLKPLPAADPWNDPMR